MRVTGSLDVAMTLVLPKTAPSARGRVLRVMLTVSSVGICEEDSMAQVLDTLEALEVALSLVVSETAEEVIGQPQLLAISWFRP